MDRAAEWTVGGHAMRASSCIAHTEQEHTSSRASRRRDRRTGAGRGGSG